MTHVFMLCLVKIGEGEENKTMHGITDGNSPALRPFLMPLVKTIETIQPKTLKG